MIKLFYAHVDISGPKLSRFGSLNQNKGTGSTNDQNTTRVVI